MPRGVRGGGGGKTSAGTSLTHSSVENGDTDSSDDTGPSSNSGGGGGGRSQITQAERSVAALPPAEVDQLVNDVVIYLLLSDQKKLPIKRQDISKNVLKDNKRAFSVLIGMVRTKLEKVFGIRLVELEQNRYILVNAFENKELWKDATEECHAKTGLIIIILALIFMRGNKIGEDELYEALRKLGVDVDKTHDVFGDVRRLITVEFVRHGYIDSSKQVAVDPPKFNFEWGPRAEAEMTKRDVLDFVCSIYDNMTPDEWPTQWRDVLASENGGD